MINGKASVLAEVPLTDIEISSTNKIFREESAFSQERLQELIDSVREKGLAQPILIRPNKKNGKYILVAGERRFRASKFIQILHKDRSTIPAYIRDLDDEEAFDLQLTENIQREDVHPMREAKAYKFLHDSKKWTTAELAARFGKSETYVLQRLKLNTLIEEAAGDFLENKMTLGHAILIARLTPDDQKEVVKRCSQKHGKDKYYESIHELEEFIQDNIVRDLKEATFDTNDPKLLPKAGACVNCSKRSGFATQLFPDVKDKDRCFDGACFAIKRAIALLTKVKELVETKPDTIFLESGVYHQQDKVSPQIMSFLASQKIKPLSYTKDDFKDWQSDYSGFNKRITGFFLNGDKAGRFGQVWIKGPKSKGQPKSSTSSDEMSAQDRKEAIARIQERTKRAAELDDEKVYVRILEGLNKSQAFKREKKTAYALPIDKVIMRWIILQHAGYDKHYLSGFSIAGNAETQIKTLAKLSDVEFTQIARRIMLKEYSGQSPTVHQAAGRILWKLAEVLKEVPVSEYVKEQNDVRAKREANAKARIEALKPTKKKKK